jgi:TolA-binding protein
VKETVVSDTSWHLDKRVPISLILALLVQTAGMVWWAASLSGRVDVNARDIRATQSEMGVLRSSAQTQAVQLGRIEEQISGLRGDIARLTAAIERAQR